MPNIFKDGQGKEITVEDIKEGLWITTQKGVQHGLHNTIPRKCDECGFPAMEIGDRDFKRQVVTLGCPWCRVHRELCLVCGKMEYFLPDNHHH